MIRNKIRQQLFPLATAMALVAVLTVPALTGCTQSPVETETTAPVATEPEIKTEPLAMEQRSLLLSKGQITKLTVTGGSQISYSSSNTQVATVSDDGTVTAVSKGNALLTVTSGDECCYCGVIVDSEGKLVDVTKLKAKNLFSSVALYHQAELISFAVDNGGENFYFSQRYGNSSYGYLPSDTMLTKVSKADGSWQRSEYVHLYNNGYGYFGLEQEENDTYLLTESNGAFIGFGKDISRVKWENKAMYDEKFGQTWSLNELNGFVFAQSDVENEWIVAYVKESATEKYYAIYDRQALLSGEEPVYLHKVYCQAGQSPAMGVDDSDGKYNSSVRGFVVRDGYIYQISGVATVYLSVFDLNGQLQYCTCLNDLLDDTEQTPVGIGFDGEGKPYLAAQSNYSSAVYRANVWTLEEVQK